MKTILFLAITFVSYANSINLKTTIDNELVDGLIKPIWQSIPYSYSLDKHQQIISNEISYSIEKGNLLLAPTRVPLFNIEISDHNKVGLKWNLKDASADVLIKIRFKFKQFGIQITHDEYFKADLSKIKSAYSNIEIISGDQLKFIHQGSTDFNFDSIRIVARDGIGSTLRYILDNIFSKKEIDKLIKNAINSNLQDWINNSQVIKLAEDEINQNIQDNLNLKRDLPNIASTISFDLNNIEFSSSQLKVQVAPNFHETYRKHECATEIEDKGEIDISRSIFEKIIDNLSINEIIVNSRVMEPILCLGYKDGQDGEEVSLVFLNRKVDFKLWLRPNKKVNYFYQNEIIKIELNLTSEILTQQYPHIYVVGNKLTSKSTLEFKLELTQKGLVLNFQDLKINSITGRAHVKWSRFIPKVRLPLNIIAKRLENELSENLKNQFDNFILLDSELEINTDYKAQLKTYTNDGSFNVGFDIK